MIICTREFFELWLFCIFLTVLRLILPRILLYNYYIFHSLSKYGKQQNIAIFDFAYLLQWEALRCKEHCLKLYADTELIFGRFFCGGL
jgi:hypothetical protein